MSTATSAPPTGDETYTGQGSKVMESVMARRTAKSHADFFTPHLLAGMRVLDCGCGPGTITCDLAELVPPGYVVGIDQDPAQIDAARAHAAARGIGNVHFQTGNAYELCFPDGYFDAVFSHDLLDHLSEPLKAVQEFRRVTRSGGLIGLRAPDFRGHIIAPDDSPMHRFLELWEQFVIRNGGSSHVGSRLRGLLHQVGCVRVVATASYECHGTEASLAQLGGMGEGMLGSQELFVRGGVLDAARAEELRQALQAWSQRPDAFLARPWCEAVGWLP